MATERTCPCTWVSVFRPAPAHVHRVRLYGEGRQRAFGWNGSLSCGGIAQGALRLASPTHRRIRYIPGNKRHVAVQLLVGLFARVIYAANRTDKRKNGEGKLSLAFAALTRVRLKPRSARYCALLDSSICLLVV